MSSVMIAAVLVGLSVMTLFIAMRSMLPQGDPIEDRLKEFGLTEYVRQGNRAQANNEHKERFQGLEKLAHGFGFGEKLQTMLVRADVPMSTGEFLAILLAVAGGGFLLGAWRAGL